LKSPLSIKKKKLRTKRHSYGKTHFPKKNEKNKMKKKKNRHQKAICIENFCSTSSSSFFGKWEIFELI
jgi:hypothetical protein